MGSGPPTPYYADDTTTLYHGDMRNVLPLLGQTFDCAVTDPPYEETPLRWDRWPDGWPDVVADVTSSMWCLGSLRLFLRRGDQFTRLWRLSHDVVWSKHTGSSFTLDRFRRTHELAVHWYRGRWNALYHAVPKIPYVGPDRGSSPRRASAGSHLGRVGLDSSWVEDGTRYMASVIPAKTLRGVALHPTEKPAALLRPLIEYACPPGGVVLDPFAGSGSTAVAARMGGWRAVLVEADERYCEVAARRLSQGVLSFGEGET
ncbi:DNA-methyltransferase [Micromonospora wenchangensis]|uniref:DNA-methyltransferase n=1 Tax=Micromonospora wenchangensis TaxID=1185415 RepID=UPI0038135C85